MNLFEDKQDIPINMKLTTFKKIKGYLTSIINENELGHIPGTFNMETIMSLPGVQFPKKIQF